MRRMYFQVSEEDHKWICLGVSSRVFVAFRMPHLPIRQSPASVEEFWNASMKIISRRQSRAYLPFSPIH